MASALAALAILTENFSGDLGAGHAMQNRSKTRGDLPATINSLNQGYKRANLVGEKLFRLIFGLVLLVGSAYAVFAYALPLHQYAAAGAFGGNDTLVAMSWFPVGLCGLVGLGGLILLWEGIAALVPANPLDDEKAHGAAARADPERTAAGAAGAQREPIHDRKFRD